MITNSLDAHGVTNIQTLLGGLLQYFLLLDFTPASSDSALTVLSA